MLLKNPYKRWFLATLALIPVTLVFIGASWRALLLQGLYSQENFRLPEHIDTVIQGGSHSACTFDPDVFGNAVNLAADGETLFFTYYKTKLILDANPSIDTIVTGLSPGHISAKTERWLSDSAEAKHHYNTYFMILDDAGRALLDRTSANYFATFAKYELGLPLGFWTDLPLYLKYLRGKTSWQDYRFSDGYTELELSDLDRSKIDKRIRVHFYDGDQVSGLSAVALEYLQKLLDMSRDRGVRVVLVNTPLYEYYRDRIPPFFEKSYSRTVTAVLETHPEVLYFDYSQFDLEDKYYLNGDHTNTLGGTIVSKALMTGLTRGSVNTSID